jgi:hypothetical protein
MRKAAADLSAFSLKRLIFQRGSAKIGREGLAIQNIGGHVFGRPKNPLILMKKKRGKIP